MHNACYGFSSLLYLNFFQVMGELIEGGIAPTSSLYVEIFDSLSQGGHTHLIPQVWERIEDTSDIKQSKG